jgi:IS30 family transposase
MLYLLQLCPASVEDRAVASDWEGDLLGGSKNSHIATLVDRNSRYVMLAKAKNRNTESAVTALIKQSRKLLGDTCLQRRSRNTLGKSNLPAIIRC